MKSYVMYATTILILILAYAHASNQIIQRNSKKVSWAIAPNIGLEIPKRALDAYLESEGLKEVEVTADIQEIRTDQGRLGLILTFAPSGIFFEPNATLKLKGDYVDANLWLYDENGEALEGKHHKDKAGFIVYHFSSYYYDDYDY